MNMQRNILIAALAVITYLMILQWNKDYVEPVAEAAVNGSSPQAHTADVPALPGTPADAVTENGDVPLAVEADGSDIPALQPTTTASTASGLISIETDTLRLTIDPRGGDIVSLALPEYPVHQQRPRSEEHTSELQSRPHLVCRLLLEKT